MAEEWFIATYLWYVFCLEIHRGALSLLKIKIVSYLSLVDCVSFLSIGMSKFFVFWFAIPQFLIWFFYIPWYAIFYNPFDQEWRIEKYIEFNSCLHNIFFQSSTHDKLVAWFLRTEFQSLQKKKRKRKNRIEGTKKSLIF